MEIALSLAASLPSPDLAGALGFRDEYSLCVQADLLFGPVLDLQALYAPEVLHIAGDDNRPYGPRVCRNHQVSSANVTTDITCCCSETACTLTASAGDSPRMRKMQVSVSSMNSSVVKTSGPGSAGDQRQP